MRRWLLAVVDFALGAAVGFAAMRLLAVVAGWLR